MGRIKYIVLIVLFLIVALYALPPTRPHVIGAFATIAGGIGGIQSSFQATAFYQSFIKPQLFLIGFGLGGVIIGITAILLHKGYLSGIRHFGRKGQQIAGYVPQTQPRIQPTVIPQATPQLSTTPTPVPPPEPKPQETTAS